MTPMNFLAAEGSKVCKKREGFHVKPYFDWKIAELKKMGKLSTTSKVQFHSFSTLFLCNPHFLKAK